MTASAATSATRTWARFAFGSWTDPSSTAPPPDTAFDPPLLRSLGIWPFVYRALRAADDGRARAFADDYRHATTANLIRLTRGAQVSAALAEHGVTAVALKGVAFTLRFCAEHPGLRPMADLDLLVPRAQYADAVAVLVARGFVAADSETRASRRAAHAGSFIDPAGAMPLDLDLHDALAPWPVATALTRRILDRHERSGPWRIPTLADAFCVTALHRARHAFSWSALDLFELKRTALLLGEDEWADVIDACRRAHIAGAVWASYNQAVGWLGEDEGDAHRLARLAGTLGPRRRALLARIAAPERVATPDERWARPFARNFILAPLTITTPLRAALAAVRILPLRVLDEWATARRPGRGTLGRVRWLWGRAVKGARFGEDPANRVS